MKDSKLPAGTPRWFFYYYGKYCLLSAYASAKALKWGYTRVYYFCWRVSGLSG